MEADQTTWPSYVWQDLTFRINCPRPIPALPSLRILLTAVGGVSVSSSRSDHGKRASETLGVSEKDEAFKKLKFTTCIGGRKRLQPPHKHPWAPKRRQVANLALHAIGDEIPTENSHAITCFRYANKYQWCDCLLNAPARHIITILSQVMDGTAFYSSALQVQLDRKVLSRRSRLLRVPQQFKPVVF